MIVLRDLRAKLAESLAQVHAAASLLHLKAAKVRDSESGEDFDPQLLERIARQAIQDSCTSTAKARSILACSRCSVFSRRRPEFFRVFYSLSFCAIAS